MNIRTTTSAPTPILPGDPPRRSRTTVLVAVLALLCLAAGAVVVVNLTRDDGVVSTETSAQPTPSVNSTPTVAADPQAAAKTAVIDAYVRAYKAVIVVGKEATPSPNDPRLSEHKTGAALVAVQRAIADNNSKGLVYSGDAELHPTVIELGSNTATVVDCSIDRTALVERRTGSTVVPAGKGEGLAATAKLILEGGVWKVSDFKAENRPCVPPAA